jgi:hypothetical protein
MLSGVAAASSFFPSLPRVNPQALIDYISKEEKGQKTGKAGGCTDVNEEEKLMAKQSDPLRKMSSVSTAFSNSEGDMSDPDVFEEEEIVEHYTPQIDDILAAAFQAQSSPGASAEDMSIMRQKLEADLLKGLEDMSLGGASSAAILEEVTLRAAMLEEELAKAHSPFSGESTEANKEEKVMAKAQSQLHFDSQSVASTRPPSFDTFDPDNRIFDESLSLQSPLSVQSPWSPLSPIPSPLLSPIPSPLLASRDHVYQSQITNASCSWTQDSITSTNSSYVEAYTKAAHPKAQSEVDAYQNQVSDSSYSWPLHNPSYVDAYCYEHKNSSYVDAYMEPAHQDQELLDQQKTQKEALMARMARNENQMKTRCVFDMPQKLIAEYAAQIDALTNEVAQTKTKLENEKFCSATVQQLVNKQAEQIDALNNGVAGLMAELEKEKASSASQQKLISEQAAQIDDLNNEVAGLKAKLAKEKAINQRVVTLMQKKAKAQEYATSIEAYSKVRKFFQSEIRKCNSEDNSSENEA